MPILTWLLAIVSAAQACLLLFIIALVRTSDELNAVVRVSNSLEARNPSHPPSARVLTDPLPVSS